jgi:predicted DNA binding CopG/RHH family protein
MSLKMPAQKGKLILTAPARIDADKSTQITLRLPADLLTDADKAARRVGIPRATFIKMALRKMIDSVDV